MNSAAGIVTPVVWTISGYTVILAIASICPLTDDAIQ